MEMGINIQQVVNELENVFVTDNINVAERNKNRVIRTIKSINPEIAEEINKLLLQTEGYKNAIDMKNMKSDIRFYNIKIEDKYYDYDWDDPRYDINDKVKSINKEYIYSNMDMSNIDIDSNINFNYVLQDCLEEIGQDYCYSLLDTTLDDIIIYCDIIMTIDTETEIHYKIAYNYSATNPIKIIE